MNKLILIGNVGRDPEMKYTPNGQAVTSFSVASNHKYKTASGEQREETAWFNCQAWGKLAEVTNQYLTKGQQVFIEGRVKLRTYDKQGGGQGASLDVSVANIQFLGKRDGQRSSEGTVDDEADNSGGADDSPF
jgi:single-strand DNA-binding protein